MPRAAIRNHLAALEKTQRYTLNGVDCAEQLVDAGDYYETTLIAPTDTQQE